MNTTYIIVILCAIIIVALCFAGLGIKMIFKKNGEFKRHCASVDPYTGQRSGCVCGKTVSDTCDDSPEYHPLEVNEELMIECGTLHRKDSSH